MPDLLPTLMSRRPVRQCHVAGWRVLTRPQSGEPSPLARTGLALDGDVARRVN